MTIEPPLYLYAKVKREGEMRAPGRPQVAAFYWFLRDQVFLFNPRARTLKEPKEKQIPAISKQFQHYKSCSPTVTHLILATMLSNTVIPSKTLIFACEERWIPSRPGNQ